MRYRRSRWLRQMIVAPLCVTMLFSGCGPCSAPPPPAPLPTPNDDPDPEPEPEPEQNELKEQVDDEWGLLTEVQATGYDSELSEDPGITLGKRLADIDIEMGEDSPKTVPTQGVFLSKDSLWVGVAVQPDDVLDAEMTKDNSLTLTPRAPGICTITLTAYSHRGHTLSTSFRVSVPKPESPDPQVLFQGGNDDWHKGEIEQPLGDKLSNLTLGLHAAFKVEHADGAELEYGVDSQNPKVATVDVDNSTLTIDLVAPGDTEVTITAQAILEGAVVAERQHSFRLRILELNVIPYEYFANYFREQQRFEPIISIETFCSLLREIKWPDSSDGDEERRPLERSNEEQACVHRIRAGLQARAAQAVGSRQEAFDRALATFNGYEQQRTSVFEALTKLDERLAFLSGLEERMDTFIAKVEALEKGNRVPVSSANKQTIDIIGALFEGGKPSGHLKAVISPNASEEKGPDTYGAFVTKCKEHAQELVGDLATCKQQMNSLEAAFPGVRDALNVVRNQHLDSNVKSDKVLRQDIADYLQEEEDQLQRARRRLDRFEAEVMAWVYLGMVMSGTVAMFPLVLALYLVSRPFREFVNSLFAKGGGKGDGKGNGPGDSTGETPEHDPGGGGRDGDDDGDDDTGGTSSDKDQDDEEEASTEPDLPEDATRVETFDKVEPDDWRFQVYTTEGKLWFCFWKVVDEKLTGQWEVYLPNEPRFSRTGLWTLSGLTITIAKAPSDPNEWPRQLTFAGFPDRDRLTIVWRSEREPIIPEGGPPSPLPPPKDDPEEIEADGTDFYVNASKGTWECRCGDKCPMVEMQLREREGEQRVWIEDNKLVVPLCQKDTSDAIKEGPIDLLQVVPPKKGLFPVTMVFRANEDSHKEIEVSWKENGSHPTIPPPD